MARVRWQDDHGNEYLLPSFHTTSFRCIIMDMRRPPLFQGENGKYYLMSKAQYNQWLPKLDKAFKALYNDYKVSDNEKTGKGRIVKPLVRYLKTEKIRKQLMRTWK